MQNTASSLQNVKEIRNTDVIIIAHTHTQP